MDESYDKYYDNHDYDDNTDDDTDDDNDHKKDSYTAAGAAPDAGAAPGYRSVGVQVAPYFFRNPFFFVTLQNRVTKKNKGVKKQIAHSLFVFRLVLFFRLWVAGGS